MIAIYDQARTVIENIVNDVSMDEKCAISTTYHLSGQNITLTLGSYDTEAQAQYILDQIAQAIEQEKPLYRMPSVEEVEKLMSTKGCLNCLWEQAPPSSEVCAGCLKSTHSNWQPREG